VTIAASILVVEDDRHIRNIIDQVLRRDRMLNFYKLNIIMAPDGESGLHRFRQQPIDLVITDLLLPGMDGFQLVHAIRQAVGDKLPILVMTAVYRDPETLDELKRKYSVDVETKPFNLRLFADRVRNLLIRSLEGRDDGEEKAKEKKKRPKPKRTTPPVVDDATRGDLSKTSLPHLLFRGLEKRFTGILALQRGKVQKEIYILSGHPIFVESNIRAETLGQLLLKRGGITPAEHERVLGNLQRKGNRYGESLVELNIMKEEQVLLELAAQTRYKIEVCLVWRDGSWQMIEDSSSCNNVPRCTVNPESLVFEGLKRRLHAEEAVGRMMSAASSSLELLARFRNYRGSYEKVFGLDVTHRLQDGPQPVGSLMQGGDYWARAQQMDSLLLCGLARLLDLDAMEARDQAEPGETGPHPSVQVGGVVGGASMPMLEHLLVEEERRDTLRSTLGHQKIKRDDAEPVAEPVVNNEAESEVENVAQSELELEAEANEEPVAESEEELSLLPPDAEADSSETPENVEESESAKQLIQSTYLGIHDKTHYETLDVDAKADLSEIKMSYEIKRSQFDLGRFKELDLGAAYGHLEEICDRLENAFTVLSEPSQRHDYDERLGFEGPSHKSGEIRIAALQAEEKYRTGEARLEAGRYDDAEEFFAGAVALDSQPEYQAKHALASFLNSEKSHEVALGAMVQVKTILVADPQNPVGHEVAAKISTEMGLFDEAAEHYQSLLKMDPQNKNNFDRLAELFLELDRFEELEEQYRLTIHKLDRSVPEREQELWIGLAELYRDHLKDKEKSEKAFGSATRLSRHTEELQAVERARERGNVQREEFDGGLDSLLWDRLKHADDSSKLVRLFQQLAPVMAKLHSLSSAEATQGAQKPESLPAPLAAELERVVGLLQCDQPEIFVRDNIAAAIEVAQCDDPILIVGPEVFHCTDRVELGFRLARALTFTKPGYHNALIRSADLLVDYVLGAVGLAYPQIPLPDIEGRVREIKDSVASDPSLLRLLKGSLASLCNPMEEIQITRWRSAAEKTANRFALLVCGDLSIALRVLAAVDANALGELAAFAQTVEYKELQERAEFSPHALLQLE
jgi:DNA-binding response OmpR family regulator/tetratricopeptide (TPR) repeat protein